MKRLLSVVALIGLLLLLVPVDSAEAQGFGGVKGGLVWSNLRGDTGNPGVAYERGSGWSAGIFLSMGAGSASVQPEILYTRRKIDIQAGGVTGSSFEIDYVEVPVLVRMGAGSTAFYVGGYGALKVDGKAVTGSGEGRTELDIASSVQDYDYGYLAGIEIGFGGFGVDVRLTRGLRAIFKDQEGVVAPDLKHGAFSALAFYRF